MKTFSRAALLASALLAAPAAFAAASVAQEAQALIDAGKAGDALSKLDSHLSSNPQDAEARFVRGLALVKLNRGKDAIRVFADLTRDYPALPEPYNNLAALYAAQGDYLKARDALQAAVAKNPGYALAHENLGDIYATLASAAYGKAASLNPGNAGVKRKLGVVSQLASTGSNLTQASTPQPIAMRAAPLLAPAAPVAAVAAPSTAPVAAAAPSAEPDLETAQKQAALDVVQAWAKAWSDKNVDAYLAAYASEFTPEGGLSHETWETQRRDRISRAKEISVSVEKPEVSPIEDGAMRVSFRQVYKSDAFNDSSNKVLELVPINGSWKIVREYSR